MTIDQEIEHAKQRLEITAANELNVLLGHYFTSTGRPPQSITVELRPYGDGRNERGGITAFVICEP